MKKQVTAAEIGARIREILNDIPVGRLRVWLLMSVLLGVCPLHAGWIDAEPRLAPSQLDFRIRLAEQRLHAYPADSLDFVMIDLERPEDSVRHAWQCVGDMTGRTIEFLAETRRIMPDLARGPVDALYARMRRAPRQPAWLARRYFPYWKLTRDPELLDWTRKTYAHMAETADKPDRKDGHSVFCCSQVEGLADLWEVTRDPKLVELAKADAKRSLAARYRHSHHHMNAARAALKMARVTGERSFVELVRPLRDELLSCQYADGSVAEVLPTSERTEGCSISDWVSMNLRWWDVTGDESALDVAEHALVNGLWLNQFTSGAFGHREYKRNGYGTEIQEAWWCCTQNAGLIMCEVARHAVQMSSDGRTFRVNFPFPGRYGFVRDGKRVEVEVKSDYPAAYAAEAAVVGAPDAAVVFRVPKYVRNAVAAKTGEGAWRLTGDVGHYLEQRGGGWTVNYGPLMLSPMVYSWENFSSAGDVPAGYIPPTVDGSSLLLPAKLETDANGFVKFPGGRACLPEWPVFDDGAVSRTGTGFRAPALVTLKDGTGKDKQLYFHPLCAQTSCGVLRYMPMVFARE